MALFAPGIALLLFAFASPIAAIGEEELFGFRMLQRVVIGDLARRPFERLRVLAQS